jgi:hypothetical protein
MNAVNKQGLLYFHQGFTDIINQLSLIDYYSPMYENLTVIMREDASGYVDFYCRNKKNVGVLYTPLPNIHSQSILQSLDLSKYDLLFHGYYDNLRRPDDKYRGAFIPAQGRTQHFVEAFFVGYDINYNVLFDCFNFERDLELEEKVYNNFINEHGENYVLVHESQERPISLQSEHKIINIGSITPNMFEFIKVLQNAKEIHLIDSLWGRFCYLIDANSGVLQNVSVKIYPFIQKENRHEDRLGGCVGTMPKELSNWTIG